MMTTHTINTTTSTFMQEVVEASATTPVLVDFWADWCGPCKQLMPVLERLASEYAGRFILAKVNADQQQELTQRVGVRSLPTVVMFKDGQIVDHFVGAIPESQIRQLLDKYIAAPQLSPLQFARGLKAEGKFEAAELIIDEALLTDATNLELRAELGEIKALRGDIEQAKQILASVEAKEPASHFAKRLVAIINFSDTIREHPDIDSVRASIASNPNDPDARHALAVHRLLAGDFDAALNDWLELMRSHRHHKDDLARKSLLMAFEVIGSGDPRVAQTRREMARLLF